MPQLTNEEHLQAMLSGQGNCSILDLRPIHGTAERVCMASKGPLSELRRCPGPPALHGRHAHVALAVIHCSAQEPHHLWLEWMQQRVRHLHHVLQQGHCSVSRGPGGLAQAWQAKAASLT